ncbi:MULTISPECIES: hypothetical protein [Rhodococcus]|uniref:hypothetical protein n=1 Tax=Rhodococcus TaxID=1827 RepID=UPI0007AE46EA|nr:MULTISPECIES: hypothetical protein [Rhodococcus]KZL33200.1 hypothetical protein A3852_12955 [Rhodococcus qingshengii]MCE4161641.1 hypothetical protein [Rhodococcus sp. Ni2]
MSLAATLERADTATSSVEVWLSKQPAEERGYFDEYLRRNRDDPHGWPVTVLHAACRERGLTIRTTAFRDYCRNRKAAL